MNDNQQNNGHQTPVVPETPEPLGDQHPNAAKTKSWMDTIKGIWQNTQARWGMTHVSPHAKGRRRPKNWRKARKARQRMTKASRKINRGK